jgi:hypothetical protein
VKRPILLAVAAVFIVAGSSYAGLGWRDKVQSIWPEKPVQIDGRATEWSELPLAEVGGLSFRAMNDSSNLYLLIRGANDESRILLSGTYRQNVTVWFLKPNGKSRAWGITLDFGRAHAPEPAMADANGNVREMTSLSDMGIAPEMVLPQGLEVSTAPFPVDFAFQADLSTEYARQPLYEVQIPLTMIEHNDRSILFDVESSAVSPQVKAELQGHPANGSQEPPGGGHGGGRHGHGMGGPGGGRSAPASAEPPKPIHLHLAVSLAKAPKP